MDRRIESSILTVLITNFVKCVNWKMPGEDKQALEMLALWTPPNPSDALELLGPTFTYPVIRRYAIGRFNQAHNEDLMLYLLQLVQPLKYETFESNKLASQRITRESERDREGRNVSVEYTSSGISTSSDSDFDLQSGTPDVSSFLITRAYQNSSAANYFYWYLSIECEEQPDPAITVKQDTRVREMYLTVIKIGIGKRRLTD